MKLTVEPTVALRRARGSRTCHAICGANRVGHELAAGVAVTVVDWKLFTALEPAATATEIGAAPHVVVETEVETVAD